MRSTIAILIVCTFAYLAHSQNTCASPAPAGCASCTGLAALPNQCTSCSSGYILSGAISACGTACGTGCWSCTNATVCLVCSAGYTLYSTTGVCVALPTGCTAGNATNATAVTCTAVWSNYTLYQGGPVMCGTGTSTANGTTWNGVLNCVMCTATNSTNRATALSGNWVQCSQCANTYVLLPITSLTTATGTGFAISTPECVPGFTALTASVLVAAAGNTYATTAPGFTAAQLGVSTGFAVASVAWTAGVWTNITVTMASSGYWCPFTAIVGGNVCTLTSATGAPVPSPAPSNCLGGMSTTAVASQAVCQYCTNSSYYLNSTVAGNACMANNASCVTQVSATNCTVAAPGYTIVNGIVTVCSNTTTSCTGGVLSTQILLATGATITGTAVTGCQYHNASGVCVQCGGYISSMQNCTACPSNCVNCTLSSGATTCTATGCSSGYSLLSNGSCAAACANGTNRSSNGSCVAYGKNMIASAVAFASLVFYYIF